MATQVCPKCDIILKKGSFELFENCPDCGTPWPVPKGAAERVVRRVKLLGVTFAALTVLPYVGVVFGILGLIWGGIALRFKRVAWGVTVMVISGIIGLLVQPAIAYVHLRHVSEQFCEYQLRMMASSLKGYYAKNHRYPESLDALTKAKFEVPKKCFSGEGYFYLPPYGWSVTTMSSTMPAATRAGFPEKGESTVIDAAAGNMPDSWATKPPGTMDRIMRAASMPATFPAEKHSVQSSDLASLLVVAELTKAHQGRRMCVMGDMSVRSISPAEFDHLLSLPQNVVFSRYLQGAWQVSTQPSKKKATVTGPVD